jgi:hypothetical protein
LNNLNITCPKRLNIVIIIKATRTALNATLLIILGFALPTIDKNTGVLPIGLSMVKKPINTVLKNKAKFCMEFMISKIVVLTY